MMRAAGFVLLGAGAYAAFLAATTPVAFVAARAREATQGALTLAQARGTIWRGDARARLVPRGGLPVEIDRIEWRFQPAKLLAGRIAFDVRVAASGLTGELEAARTLGGWQVRDLTARGDAAGLAAFAPMLGAMRPAGAMSITSPRLDWDGRALRGEATAEWRGASVGWSEVRPIGSYRASLRAAEGPAQVSIATLDGPLRVTGQGTLTLPGTLAFTGEARADAAQQPALAPLLGLMGARRADGSHAIDWRS